MKVKIIRDNNVVSETTINPKRERLTFPNLDKMMKVRIIKDGKVINDFKNVHNENQKYNKNKFNKNKNNKKDNNSYREYKFKTSSKFMSDKPKKKVEEESKTEVLLEEITPEVMEQNLDKFYSMNEVENDSTEVQLIDTLVNNKEEVKESVSNALNNINEGLENLGNVMSDIENDDEYEYEEYSELDSSEESDEPISFIDLNESEEDKYAEYADMYDDSNYEPMKRKNILNEY